MVFHNLGSAVLRVRINNNVNMITTCILFGNLPNAPVSAGSQTNSLVNNFHILKV